MPVLGLMCQLLTNRNLTACTAMIKIKSAICTTRALVTYPTGQHQAESALEFIHKQQ